jgi:hypothetical protein
MAVDHNRYALRIRFRLPPDERINSDATDLDLGSIEESLEVRLVTSETGQGIGSTAELSLHIIGFETTTAAEDAGPRFEGALKRALMAIGIGGDFGARTPQGVVTPAGLDLVEKQLGEPAAQEHLGVHIYKVGARPRYVGFSATPTVRRSVDRFVENLSTFAALDSLTPAQEIAYELFNTAQFVSSSADARFLLLFMSLEALIEQQQRPTEVGRLVDQYVELAEAREDLPDGDRRSIIGSLRWLRQESIRQAGLRFCAELGDIDVDGWKPRDLYNECYDVRNGLTHPVGELPTWNEVSNLVGPLHRLVQHSFNAVRAS